MGLFDCTQNYVTQSVKRDQTFEGKRTIQVQTYLIPPDEDPALEAYYQYTLLENNGVQLDINVNLIRELPPLPRIGLTLTLPDEFEQLTWYGLGPHETYADRKLGAKVGVYQSSVTDQYFPYVVPQEHGNHTTTRWATLTNPDGVGLLIIGQPYFDFSASHFTAADLTSAEHTYELKPRAEIILNVDYAQSGLGNASCGPGTLPEYLLTENSYSFSLLLCPFKQTEK